MLTRVARVAFIGLGTMGLPMARNLAAAGHEVVACDLDPSRAEALGGSVAATAAEAAARADLALTSLPPPQAGEHVAGGAPPRTFLPHIVTPPPGACPPAPAAFPV